MFLTGKVCLVHSNEFGFWFVYSLLCWVISCVLKRFRSAVLSLGGVAGGAVFDVFESVCIVSVMFFGKIRLVLLIVLVQE